MQTTFTTFPKYLFTKGRRVILRGLKKGKSNFHIDSTSRKRKRRTSRLGLGFPAECRSQSSAQLQAPHQSGQTWRYPKRMFRPGLRAFRTTFQPVRSNVQFRAYRRQQYRRFNATSNLLMRWAARPTFYRDVGLISLGAGGFYVYNLEEVPVRGYRRSFPCGAD